MADTVNIFFRAFLPGAGFDSNGNPKQGKQIRVGRITDDGYTTPNGLSLTALELGFTNVDAFIPVVRSVNGGTEVDATNSYVAFWDNVLSQLHIVRDDGTEASDSQSHVIDFLAVGDSSEDVETL